MTGNLITFLNNISQLWAYYFSQMFIQSTLFLVIVFGILFLLRRRNAGLLYTISILGLMKLFIPPVFIINAGFDPAYKVSALLGMNSFYKANAGLVCNFPEMMTIQQNPHLTFFSLAMLIWVTGVLFYISINIFKYLKLKKVLGNLTPVDISGTDITSISIYKSEKSHSPFVFGYFKHKIIVPKNWDNWTEECRQSVVEHEIAHIKNKDSWTCILELIAQALYIFNPAVCLLCKKIDRYREMICDDEAVKNLNISHINYSKLLIKITESVQDYDRVPIKTAFSKSSDEFKNRIMYQLNKQNNRISSRFLTALIFIVIILLIFPFSMNTTLINYTSEPDSFYTNSFRNNIKEFEVKLQEISEEDFSKLNNSDSNKNSDIRILKNKTGNKDIVYQVNKENIDKP